MLVWNANLFDQPDDLGDLARGVLDLAHGRDGLVGDLATADGELAGRDGRLVGRLGIAGILAHGGRQLLQRSRRLLERGGLLLGARGQVRNAGADLVVATWTALLAWAMRAPMARSSSLIRLES